MNSLPIRRATKKSAANFAAAATTLTLAVLAALPALAVTPGDIVLGDITVMRIRTASGGVSAEDRASKVQERINEILAIPNLTAKDVTVVASKYGPTLYVHKVKLITVDPDTAKDEGMTPDQLAKTWAHRLMGVIAQVNIRLPGGPAPATGTFAAPSANPVVAGTPPTPPTPLENVPPTGKTPDDKSTPPAKASDNKPNPPAKSPDDKAPPPAPVTPANTPANAPTSPAAPPANPPATPPTTPPPAAPTSPAPTGPGIPSAPGETSAPSAAS